MLNDELLKQKTHLLLTCCRVVHLGITLLSLWFYRGSPAHRPSEPWETLVFINIATRCFARGFLYLLFTLSELVGVLCIYSPRWYLGDSLMLNPTNTQTLGHVCEEEALFFISNLFFLHCIFFQTTNTNKDPMWIWGDPYLFSFFLHRVPP